MKSFFVVGTMHRTREENPSCVQSIEASANLTLSDIMLHGTS